VHLEPAVSHSFRGEILPTITKLDSVPTLGFPEQNLSFSDALLSGEYLTFAEVIIVWRQLFSHTDGKIATSTVTKDLSPQTPAPALAAPQAPTIDANPQS
jgi:hypothetical protein